MLDSKVRSHQDLKLGSIYKIEKNDLSFIYDKQIGIGWIVKRDDTDPEQLKDSVLFLFLGFETNLVMRFHTTLGIVRMSKGYARNLALA